jgi:hypothetical protein
MTVDTNSESTIKGKDNLIVGFILKYVEILLRIAVPTVATFYLIIQIIKPTSISIEVLLKFILFIVASLAISESINKYLTINGIKEKLDDIHKYDIPNQKLITSLNEAGIVDIEPRDDKNWLPELAQEVKNSVGPIEICTIGMPSIVDDNNTRNAILDRANDFDIRVLLLDPDSDEARRREKIEHPLGRKTIGDIESTIDWLLQKMAQNARFRVHLYQIPPMLSLFITSDHVYMEPYHFGRPDGVEGCIGGHVPNLKIKNDANNSTAYFRAHFEYLWKDSRGGRLNLDFQITGYEEGKFLKIKNNNNINIEMEGWVLAAHGENPSFEFNPDFQWKKFDEIEIILNKNDNRNDPNRMFWNIKELNNKTIFTMQNANNITVAQWSPEFPSDSC